MKQPITADDIYRLLQGQGVLMGDLAENGHVDYIDDTYIDLGKLADDLNKLVSAE